MLHTDTFTNSGHKFELISEINERTELPAYRHTIKVDGMTHGVLEGKKAEKLEWLKDHFFKFI